jgi:hypothetical protein
VEVLQSQFQNLLSQMETLKTQIGLAATKAEPPEPPVGVQVGPGEEDDFNIDAGGAMTNAQGALKCPACDFATLPDMPGTYNARESLAAHVRVAHGTVEEV